MKRWLHNPLITRRQIVSPHPQLQDVSSVFNPGGIMFEGKILLLLRVQNRARETFLLKAVSDNGTDFLIAENPIEYTGLEAFPYRIWHIYDPRIVHLEGVYYVITAVDCEAGCRLALFSTWDFCTLKYLNIIEDEDLRNGILFPRRIEGKYLMFVRPNSYRGADGVATGKSIVACQSSDLLAWQPVAEVFTGNPHYWDELIGSGAPPIKTRQGWLHIYHGVATHFGSANIYQAGVSLQDLSQPWITISRGKYNILEPREPYELTGQVPNVVFPTAAIAQSVDNEGFADPNSDVYVYYGAADTCVALAVTSINELLFNATAP